MPSSTPPLDSLDVPLFDVETLTHTLRDGRTVGEMLADVDHLARQLLMDVEGADAAALVRSWPQLVDAAQGLWFQLPGRYPNGDARDVPMEQLIAQAETLVEQIGPARRWPPVGPMDPRIEQMCTNFSAAAQLVQRYGSEIPMHREETNRDVTASRTRTMHGLYLTAHAVGVALSRESTERTGQPRTAWRTRFAFAENTAHNYLSQMPPRTLSHEVTQPVTDLSRVARALARWDIQAHRTLAASPSPDNIRLTAQTQGLIAGATMTLVAATHGSDTRDGRLTGRIAQAGQAWSHLAGRWAEIQAPRRGFDARLVAAATEVRACFRALTHDGATMATVKEIASRPGAVEATTAGLRAIENAPDLAQVLAEQARQPDLAGSAGLLSRRIFDDIEAGLIPGHRDENHLWVPLADIGNRRQIPLPKAAALALTAASDRLHEVTLGAASLAGIHHAANAAVHPTNVRHSVVSPPEMESRTPPPSAGVSGRASGFGR